jgi:hypothetical protein
MNRGHFRAWRQIVTTRIAAQDKHRVYSPQAGSGCIVKNGVCHSTPLELRDPVVSFCLQLANLPKFDGLGRTSLRACRYQSCLLPVITERALEGAPIIWIALDYSKRTRNHTVPAAIADIRLNIDAAKLGAHDRAGGTSLQAAGIFAMLADVG